MSELHETQLEQAIVTLAAMADGFTSDQYVRSRLAATRHDLQQHLAAQRWNAWTLAKQAASQRRRFLARHKGQKGVARARH
jgi:hypothetical protein